MNQKNPRSDQDAFSGELRALRSEAVPQEGIDRAVMAMQSEPRAIAKPRSALRFATGGVAVLALGTILAVRAPIANALEFNRLDKAARAQQTRHTRDFRIDEKGHMYMANEYWTEGVKYRGEYHNADGSTTIAGHDGVHSFHQQVGESAFVDDTPGDGFPIETIQDYLNIPGAQIKNIERDKQEGGIKVDVFTIAFGALVMELYIEPKSGLPLRREVRNGPNFIEENIYDYPEDVPDSKFDPPTDRMTTTDYPALRKELAKRIDGPGETKELNGVKITLYAVVVGRQQVIAIWSGGAKTDYVEEGHIHVQGFPKGVAAGMETGSVWPSNDPDRRPLLRKGQELIPDAIYYQSTDAIRGPFTLEVPVWQEDKTRPLISQEGIRVPGYHSKLLGKLTFKITAPIMAADPQRVLWRPSGWTKAATAKTE